MNAEPLEHSVWSHARWLVLSPHPDDETLGAGALINHAAAEGRLRSVAYLTDGTGSHPAGTPGIASARRSEAVKAVRRLAGNAIEIAWIGWQDAHPHDPSSSDFAREAMRFGARLRRQQIDAIAVTGPLERHCDHVAAFRLASAAVRAARRPIALFAYHVWSMPSDHRARRITTRPMTPGLRRRALQAHRSQLTPAYGEGFRLPPEQRRMASRDTLTLQARRP